MCEGSAYRYSLKRFTTRETLSMVLGLVTVFYAAFRNWSLKPSRELRNLSGASLSIYEDSFLSGAVSLLPTLADPLFREANELRLVFLR